MPSSKGLEWSCVVGLSSCSCDYLDQACSASGSRTTVEELVASGKDEEHRNWLQAMLSFDLCAGAM